MGSFAISRPCVSKKAKEKRELPDVSHLPKRSLPISDRWRRDIREERLKAGLTQAELGREVGLSQGSISNIESVEAQALLSTEGVERLSALLGVRLPAAAQAVLAIEVFEAQGGDALAEGQAAAMWQFAEALQGKRKKNS